MIASFGMNCHPVWQADAHLPQEFLPSMPLVAALTPAPEFFALSFIGDPPLLPAARGIARSTSMDLWRDTSLIFRISAPASAALVRNPARILCPENRAGSKPARRAASLILRT